MRAHSFFVGLLVALPLAACGAEATAPVPPSDSDASALFDTAPDDSSAQPDSAPDTSSADQPETLGDDSVTLAEVEVDSGPSEAERAAIHTAIDDFIDLRFEAPAGATEALVERIAAAGLSVADVEALLRQGRASYPAAPQRLVAVGEYVDDATKPDGYDWVPPFESAALDCYNYDYSTVYYIYVPTSYRPDRATPLVYVGHGGNSAMTDERARIVAELYLDFYYQHLGEEMGAIVVAPATSRGWGAVGNSIILSTLSKVSRDYNIDPERVYITGHSMGGHMSWRTAMTFGDRFGAASPQSGGYDVWATSDALANAYTIPGYTTYGTEEPFGLNATNHVLADWLRAHNYPWVTVEKDGGHEVYDDELPKVAAFFMQHPRAMYRPTVFFRAGGTMLQADETNAAWTPTTAVADKSRPIRWNLRHWIEMTPRPEITDPLAFFAENKGDNRIEIRTHNIRELRVMLHPAMVDMSRPVEIVVNGETKFNDLVPVDLGFMLDLVRELDDRGRIFHGHVDLAIHSDVTVDVPVYPAP